ncbi:MAG: Re/Si-specific NAD(P)(+) transhydrogenase subunit alpha [Actinomycetota bacterium]|nr:Re/Si-specific NAD(P)(+) transhydrogenase subunit alpha [Actinomycetota bacterium]
MRVAVPTEIRAGERRVALVPDAIARYTGKGFDVTVQAGAGEPAGHSDEDYRAKGATVVGDVGSLLAQADLVIKVQPPTAAEGALFAENTTLVSFLQPAANLAGLRGLIDKKVTVFSLDLVPRISRAQGMDALSSQATVSGYRAALLAAQKLPKFFPMFMTAAGTVPPAKVLVLGAGVAGLQAIATCRRLGAVVRAYDVRAAAKEEVESLGATFVELELETQEGAGGYAREQSEQFLAAQRELIGATVASSDVVITTAAVPGRKAPVLVTADMVERMTAGSVIVDLAAESGGNCELTRPGEETDVGGVVIHGVTNVPSTMANHASLLFARNVANLVDLFVSEGALAPDFDDEIVRDSCVLRDGEVAHEPTRRLLEEASA